MSITVSARFSEQHLSYLFTILQSRGYTPTCYTDLMRYSTLDWINLLRASIYTAPQDQHALATIRSWRNRKKRSTDIQDIQIAPAPTYLQPSNGEPLPAKDIIPSDLYLRLPPEDQEKGLRVISVLNQGITVEEQMNCGNPEVVRLTKLIINLMEQDTKEDS